jgi:hypothetical protein
VGVLASVATVAAGVAVGACGSEAPPGPVTDTVFTPATTVAPGTTRPVGRTTTTVGGTTVPRTTPGTAPSGVTVSGDGARRAAALCLEARQIAEGPMAREQVDAASARLPALFRETAAGLPPGLGPEAADRFAAGVTDLLGDPAAGTGRGGARGALPAPFVWPAGAEAGLDACFVRTEGSPAPPTVRLPAPAASVPVDDSGLDAEARTEVAVVDPLALLAPVEGCVADALASRRADYRQLREDTLGDASGTAWADGVGELAQELAAGCAVMAEPVRADGTSGTLVFLAPPGSFSRGQGPDV